MEIIDAVSISPRLRLKRSALEQFPFATLLSRPARALLRLIAVLDHQKGVGASKSGLHQGRALPCIVGSDPNRMETGFCDPYQFAWETPSVKFTETTLVI